MEHLDPAWQGQFRNVRRDKQARGALHTLTKKALCVDGRKPASEA